METAFIVLITYIYNAQHKISATPLTSFAFIMNYEFSNPLIIQRPVRGGLRVRRRRTRGRKLRFKSEQFYFSSLYIFTICTILVLYEKYLLWRKLTMVQYVKRFSLLGVNTTFSLEHKRFKPINQLNDSVHCPTRNYAAPPSASTSILSSRLCLELPFRVAYKNPIYIHTYKAYAQRQGLVMTSFGA